MPYVNTSDERFLPSDLFEAKCTIGNVFGITLVISSHMWMVLYARILHNSKPKLAHEPILPIYARGPMGAYTLVAYIATDRANIRDVIRKI